MKKEYTIPELAEMFELKEEFLTSFRERIEDKENFYRAVKMFSDGELPYAVATGDGTINIASLRHDLAVKKLDFRKNQDAQLKEAFERHQKIMAYYATCQCISKRFKNGVIHRAYIKDGHLVALANQYRNQGGFYCAKNEVMPDFRWREVKQFLFNIRRDCKAYFRDIKRAAYADDKALFDFSERTIVKQKPNE